MEQGVQADADARPTAEDQEPAGQGTQPPPCPALLHVPCGHATHTACVVAPADAEKVPAEQGRHAKGVVAADELLYEPAEQRVQRNAPSPDQLPAAHGTQPNVTGSS
jgi:hypothetical protein